MRETSFTDSNDNKTVTITRRENRIASAHEIVFTDTHALPDNIVGTAIEGFISKEYNIGNFKFDDRVVERYELRSRVGSTEHNNITFKPRTTRNKFGQPQIVLKRDNDGALQCNTAQVAQKAVTQFKELIDVIIDNRRERETLRENMPMVDIDNQLEWEDENGNINNDVIHGLSPNEIRELRGVLFPSDTIDPKTRIGHEVVATNTNKPHIRNNWVHRKITR